MDFAGQAAAGGVAMLLEEENGWQAAVLGALGAKPGGDGCGLSRTPLCALRDLLR